MADDDIPKTAKALLAKAEKNGWLTSCIVTDTVFGGKPILHVAIRVKRDNAFLAAFYENGSFRCGVACSPDAAKLNSRELTALVETTEPELGPALAALLAERRAKKEAS